MSIIRKASGWFWNKVGPFKTEKDAGEHARKAYANKYLKSKGRPLL